MRVKKIYRHLKKIFFPVLGRKDMTVHRQKQRTRRREHGLTSAHGPRFTNG